MDCAIRKGKYNDQNVDQPDVPGICAVGRIVKVGTSVSKDQWKNGDRVATLMIKGGNARYATQTCSKLIKIPEDASAKETCSILCAYMSAFACLKHECPKHQRYTLDSLRGKTVFINGGMSVVGQAAIYLSSLLGASYVYATGKPKDFKHLKKLGAVPLHLCISNTNPELENKMDLIIDCTSFDALDFLTSLKTTQGALIIYEYGDISESGRHGWRNGISKLLLKVKLVKHWNSFFCDPINEIFYRNFELFKVQNMRQNIFFHCHHHIHQIRHSLLHNL
jgi:NADPH:quinone reductase-like Zn-dependent oxidoreductase